jgi:hypothetical protein
VHNVSNRSCPLTLCVFHGAVVVVRVARLIVRLVPHVRLLYVHASPCAAAARRAPNCWRLLPALPLMVPSSPLETLIARTDREPNEKKSGWTLERNKGLEQNC